VGSPKAGSFSGQAVVYMRKNLKQLIYRKNLTRTKSKDLVQAEIKTLIHMMESLKNEDGLWSSKISEISCESDPFVTAAILWFITDAYEKARVSHKLRGTYKVLEKRLYVKIDELTSQTKWRERLEAFQILLLLLAKGSKYIDYKRLKTSTLDIFWKKNEDILEDIVKIDPLTEPNPAIIMITLLLSDKKGKKELEILKKFMEELIESKTGEADMFSVYWISELLILLYKDEELNDSFKQRYIQQSFHKMSGMMKSMFVREDEIWTTPFDKLALSFLTIGNLLYLSKNLAVRDEKLESMHKKMLEYILDIIRIETIRLEKRLARAILEVPSKENEKERVNLDSMILALTIASLEKSRKLIVNYVTEYDLTVFEKIRKISFIVGVLMLIMAGLLLNLTFIQIFFQRDPFLLPHNLSYLLPLIIYFFISVGVNILYRLARQSLWKWDDLKKAIIDAIIIVIKVIFSIFKRS
jgi:hypothetical protein